MHDYGLGPNGAMIYVMEHLEENMDWLVSRLDEVLGAGQGEAEQGDGGEADESAAYVIFDTPGQVELWTNHDSLKRVIVGLTKMDYRVSERVRELGQERWSETDFAARRGPFVRCALHYRREQVHLGHSAGAAGYGAAGAAACQRLIQDRPVGVVWRSA